MPRIVSLIASATEIVHALGQFDHLVGRSHECYYPPEVKDLPCCTRPAIAISGSSRDIDDRVKNSLRNALSIYEIFDDALERLQPTHIITQTQCEVCAVSLRDLERSVAGRLASRPQIVSLQPNSLADIWEDMRRVAASLGIDGEPAIHRLQARMEAVSRRARAHAERPTVACIEWLEPLMAAGNWCPELVEMAGGINLFGEAGKHSPWMTWEELAARDPDVIIVMPCGFDLARTESEVHWLMENPVFPRLTGRIYLADGNQYFNRPGPRVVECLEMLAEMLHGLAAQKATHAGMPVLREIVVDRRRHD